MTVKNGATQPKWKVDKMKPFKSSEQADYQLPFRVMRPGGQIRGHLADTYPGCVIQEKWDGSNVILSHYNGGMAFNRRGIPFKQKGVPQECIDHAVKHRAVVNGELVHRPSYHADLPTECYPVFVPFDLLMYHNIDIRATPLSYRLECLEEYLLRPPKFVTAERDPTKNWIVKRQFELKQYGDSPPRNPFREALEGYVVKPWNSFYVGGDSRRIRKMRFK